APDSHRLAGRSTLDWQELAGETWITTRQGTAGAECLRRLCARARFEPRIGFRSNDYDVVREFVRSGLGLVLVPARCGGAIDGTIALPNENGEVLRRVSVLQRGEKLDPVVSGFLTAVRAATAEISSAQVRPEPVS